MSRRRFIRSGTHAATLASAFPYVSRARVLGANDRIGIGFIGVGERGRTHVAVVQKLIQGGENLRIAAATDAYRYRLDEMSKRLDVPLIDGMWSCWLIQESMRYASPRRTGIICGRECWRFARVVKREIYARLSIKP